MSRLSSMLPAYLVVIASVAVAAVLSRLLSPITEPNPLLLFFGAVVVSAWYGGFVAGFAATVLSVVAVNYMYLEPRGTLSLGVIDALRLALFSLVASLINYLQAARQRAQGEAHLQREWSQTALTAIGDAVIATDAHGRISFMNPIAEQVTGWKQSEATGKPLISVFRIINEQTRNPVEDPTQRVLREGVIVGLANHTLLIAKNGDEIPIDDSGAPIRDTQGNVIGAILVFRDVSERRAAEQALVESEARFRELADTAPVLIWMADTTKQCIYFNKVWLDFTGRTPQEEYGFGWAEGVHPDDYERCVTTYTNAFDARETFSMDYRLRRHDGEYCWVLDKGIPRYAGGQFIGYLGSCIDITERKLAETRSNGLQTLMSALSGALTADEVAQVIVRQGMSILGAHVGVVTMLLPDGKTLRMLNGKGAPADITEKYMTMDINMKLPVVDAVRENRGVWVENLDTYRQLYPDLVNEAGTATGSKAVMCLPLHARGQVIGGFGMSFREERRFDDDDRAFMRALADQCALALERARLFEDEASARRQAEAAQQRMAFLSEASMLFGSSLDIEKTLQHVAERAVPRIGDWCAVDLLRDDGLIELAAVAHIDPHKVEWARELRRRYPPDPDAPSGAYHVMKTCQSEFYPLITEEMIQAANPTEEQLGLIREIGFTALMTVPLLGRKQVLGALTLVSAESGRPYTPEDLTLAEELARRASIAIENAKLYREEQEARREAELVTERVQALQQLTASFSEALTMQQVIDVMTGQAMTTLGADAGAVTRLRENDRSLEVIASMGYAPGAFEQILNAMLPPASSAIHDAIARKEPIWIESFDEYRERYPHLSSVSQNTTGARSAAIFPLIINQEAIGGVHLAYLTDRTFALEHRAFMVAVVQQFMQALERARLYELEATARRTAEEANELKLRFLAMISHELRTPLTSIKGFTTTLLANDISLSSADQRQFIEIINEETDKLSDLIEQLLDLSRLQAGTLRVTTQPQQVETILNIGMAQLRMLAGGHDLRIVRPNDLPLIMADERRIAQVLANLVGNAAKFSQPGTPIEIRIRNIGPEVQIEVADQGPGIPENAQDYIFEAFRQVEGEGRHYRGAGLGLAICKGLVERHGGRIWIEDTSAKGTTIAFTVPAASPAGTEPGSPPLTK